MNPKYKIGMRIIKTALAVGICLQVFIWLDIGSNINGVYAAVAATICMKSSLQQTLRTGIDRTAGTVIGSVIGTVFLYLSGFVPQAFFTLIAVVGVIVVIYLCNIFRLQLSVTISVVVFLVIMVVPRDVSPLFYGIARLGETLFGIFIALFINKFFDPRYLRSKLSKSAVVREGAAPAIRELADKDMGRVMQIWLNNNIRYNKSIAQDYWHEGYAAAREAILSGYTLVYDSGGGVSGFVSLTNENQIFCLSVAEESQHTGVGTTLLDRLKDRYPCLGVRIYEGNDQALRFFQNRGFAIFGETRSGQAPCRKVTLSWSVKGGVSCPERK